MERDVIIVVLLALFAFRLWNQGHRIRKLERDTKGQAMLIDVQKEALESNQANVQTMLDRYHEMVSHFTQQQMKQSGRGE